MSIVCQNCGTVIVYRPPGPYPKFCSTRCRVAAHRRRMKLKLGRWNKPRVALAEIRGRP